MKSSTPNERAYMSGDRRLPYRILEALAIEGQRTRWKRLKELAAVRDDELSGALKFLNGRGWVAGHVFAAGNKRLMEYSLTQLGFDIALAYRTGMIVVLRRHAAFVGVDGLPEYRAARPWLYELDD
jgi:hypothetical protein